MLVNMVINLYFCQHILLAHMYLPLNFPEIVLDEMMHAYPQSSPTHLQPSCITNQLFMCLVSSPHACCAKLVGKPD